MISGKYFSAMKRVTVYLNHVIVEKRLVLGPEANSCAYNLDKDSIPSPFKCCVKTEIFLFPCSTTCNKIVNQFTISTKQLILLLAALGKSLK